MALRPALQNFLARVGPAISAAWLNWIDQKNRELVSVKDHGALCDGTTDDTAAFQAAVTAASSGITTISVPATSRVTGVVTAGTGTVVWDFAQGAVITGGGTLPFYTQSMTYNSSPNYGERIQAFHGTTANPTTDGTVATAYIQRVDASVTADNASNLISNMYLTLKRAAAGRGWLYGMYSYVEDASNSGTAQSVAVAGVAHATGAVATAVWGHYSEAHAHNAANYATGSELDAYNDTGSDYSYNAADPVGVAHTKAIWLFSTGANKNTLALGIGSQSKYTAPNTVTKSWRVGMFFQTWSVTDIGIDIQAQPATLIRFRNGASTDGTGTTPTGIGLDCGSGAAYGTGTNQGAIHLRDHAFCFGDAGLGYYRHDNATGRLVFYYNGKQQGHIQLDRVTDDAVWLPTMNGKGAPRVATAATDSISTTDTNVIYNRAGTVTVTLPDPTKCAGRELIFRTVTANTVVSASSNVTPLANAPGTGLSTAILAATAGRWAVLQSDGTQWNINQAG